MLDGVIALLVGIILYDGSRNVSRLKKIQPRSQSGGRISSQAHASRSQRKHPTGRRKYTRQVIMLDTYGSQLTTYLAKLNLVLNLPFLRRITTVTSARKSLMSGLRRRLRYRRSTREVTYLDSFKTVSIEDVITAVRASPSKQCASNPLPTWRLKEAITILAPYITTILNSSITERHFPRTWRHAIVTPLLKKARLDESSPSSYRPVSNLPFLSKVLQRIVNRQLIGYLNEFHLLPDAPSAFRQCHSTETAV